MIASARFSAAGGLWGSPSFDRAAGNKRGKSEARFYRNLIATAEARWRELGD